MILRLMLSTALAAGVATLAIAQALDTGEAVTLDRWEYESLYTGGRSTEAFLNNKVDDITVGGSGQIPSVV